MNKNRLGRGLNALIPQEETSDQTQGRISEIKVSLVKPNPYQPRIDFDLASLEDLKNSIKEKGIIQPITVRKVDNHFELIAGERRLRAAIEIELEKIPAYIIKVDSKEEMLEMAIIENVQREKLNPIEQALAFQRLITECKLTQDDVAHKIGKDRTTVTNLLRLLKLPNEIQKTVKTGEISVGHARTLVSVEDRVDQNELWSKTIKNNYSVRKLEKLVKELSEIKPSKNIIAKKDSIYIHKIEENLRNIFGTKVSVRSRKEGGSIEIQFYSPEDLNRLIEIFDRFE
jgi:ParB family transcriptional regulator, chromosome partitioning protein